jgi:hypothetical protein
VEAISVKPPWYIPVSEDGAHFGLVNKKAFENAKAVQQAPYQFVVKPDNAHAFHVVVGRKGGLEGCKRVSIALHILTGWPRVRHKRKVLTAILLARIRNSH